MPELAGSAFADATVRQVMDMTVGVKYSENYTDPAAEVRTYGIAAGYGKPPEGYDGPRSIVDFLRTLIDTAQDRSGNVFNNLPD